MPKKLNTHRDRHSHGTVVRSSSTRVSNGMQSHCQMSLSADYNNNYQLIVIISCFTYITYMKTRLNLIIRDIYGLVTVSSIESV